VAGLLLPGVVFFGAGELLRDLGWVSLDPLEAGVLGLELTGVLGLGLEAVTGVLALGLDAALAVAGVLALGFDATLGLAFAGVLALGLEAALGLGATRVLALGLGFDATFAFLGGWGESFSEVFLFGAILSIGLV
jgi:hypothetical protein